MSSHSARYAAVAVAGGLLGFAAYRHSNAPPRQLTRDEALSHSDPRVRLAQCLSDKGYKLYGTSWCGWCKKQLDVCQIAIETTASRRICYSRRFFAFSALIASHQSVFLRCRCLGPRGAS
jgi:hypothetical protein